MIQVGERAPEILGHDENGNEIRLSDFAGKKLVLYFYPKDMTSGCTAEACNLRDNIGALAEAGYAVLGASVDDAKSHQKFIAKHELPFHLIADTEKNSLVSGARRACMAGSISARSALLSSSMRKASWSASSVRNKSKPRLMQAKFLKIEN